MKYTLKKGTYKTKQKENKIRWVSIFKKNEKIRIYFIRDKNLIKFPIYLANKTDGVVSTSIS